MRRWSPPSDVASMSQQLPMYLAGTGTRGGDAPVLSRLRVALPTALLFLLPLTFVIPNFVRFGDHRLNWYELLLPLIFFLGWNKAGSRVAAILVALTAATGLAILHAVFVFDAEPSAKSFSLGRYLIAYVAAIQLGLRLSFRDLDRSSLTALLAYLSLSAIVLVSAISPDIRSAVARVYGFEEHDHTRFQLIDPNPLVLGSVAIILYFFASRGRSLGVRLLLFLPTFATVVLAQQRTSLILLLLFVFLAEYVFRRRRVLAPTVATLLLAVLVIGAIAEYGGDGPAHGDRFTSFSFQRQARGIAARAIQYQLQFQQVKDFPVLGVGRFPEQVYTPLAAWYPAPRVEPHSQYVGIVYEVGLVGALVFIFLVIRVVRTGANLYNYRRNSHAARSMLAAGVMYFVAMVPWETLYLPHWSVVFFLLLGVALRDERAAHKRKTTAATNNEMVNA